MTWGLPTPKIKAQNTICAMKWHLWLCLMTLSCAHQFLLGTSLVLWFCAFPSSKIRRDHFDPLVWNPVMHQLWDYLSGTHTKLLPRAGQGFERCELSSDSELCGKIDLTSSLQANSLGKEGRFPWAWCFPLMQVFKSSAQLIKVI